MSAGNEFKRDHERLVTAERSCLLRAARNELLRLQSEHDRLTIISYAAACDVALEVRCLEKAIAWLWREQLGSDT